MKYVVSLCLALCVQPAFAEPVVVFAAASLKEPIDALAARVGDVVVSYAGSGTLARQIQQEAPADVVLLANAEWIAALPQVADVMDFASNALVLIGPVGAADLTLADLPTALGDGRLAMGYTTAVPAGVYGRQALENLDLWDAVKDRLAEVDSVRAALTLVVRGEVPFGVVYATDAQATDAVQIVARFDPTDHDPIRYVGGLVSDDPKARAFWDALRGQVGQDLLADFGYLPVNE